ncbi:MAG: hypothetical protein JO287_23120 [Pseudonocardiales bacterium]|nr:hypothetical protein [Pseudonocardiales bacterium]
MRFLPAISKDALKKISGQVRSWRLHTRIGSTFAQLARLINSIVVGWMRYYGVFQRSALYPLLEHQRLPGALDPRKVPAAACGEEIPTCLQGRNTRLPHHVRTLAMGTDRLANKMTRAR